MKSTKTVIYNYRTAQSKEKWETDFLSKINDANGLLYLAAVKSNNYTPLPKDDSYYTEENKSKILSTLDGIVSNPYNKRWHQIFAKFVDEAKAILDRKTKSKTPSAPANPTTPTDNQPDKPAEPVSPQDRPGRSTAVDKINTGNYPELGKEDLYDVSTFGVDAKEFIRDTVQPLKDLAEKDNPSFKLRGDKLIANAFSKFNANKSKFSEQESISISTMLNNLQTKYMSAFSETGLTRAGKSYAVVDYREAAQEAFSLLSDKVFLRDKKQIQERRDQLEKILNIYQNKFINKNAGNSDIEQFIGDLNKKIASWNYRYTNMRPANNSDIEMLDLLRPASRI